jgi:hypothetical protein
MTNALKRTLAKITIGYKLTSEEQEICRLAEKISKELEKGGKK